MSLLTSTALENSEPNYFIDSISALDIKHTQTLQMEVTKVVITPNQALLTAPLNVKISVNSDVTYTDVKVNSTVRHILFKVG